MKKFLFAIILGAFAAPGMAQGPHLERFVVASGGDYFSTASLNLSFTIGEMAAVETFTNPLMDLTQGFQQPNPTYKGIKENSLAGNGIQLFPNPARQFAGVRYTGLVDEKLNIKLINILGQTLLDLKFFPEVGKQDYVIDLSGVSQGLYLVEVSGKRAGIDFREQAKLTVVN